MTISAPLDDRLLGAPIVRMAHQARHRRALVCEDQQLTYAQLDHAIGVTSAGLAEAGVGHGDRVVMAGLPRIEAIVTMFALARLGAVLVPVHPTSTRSELAAIAEAVDPVAAVGDAAFVESAWDGVLALSWDPGASSALELRLDADLEPVTTWDAKVDDLAVIAFTSGTSGHPKGVLLTHENLHWGVRNALSSVDIRMDDTVLVATPLSHSAVFAGLPQYAWAVGGTVVLAPRFEPDDFADAVRDHGVTIAFVVATMLARLVQSESWTALSSSRLRSLVIGGGPPITSLMSVLAATGIAPVNSYGLTEASAGVSYASGVEAATDPLCAGVPAAHVELRVVGPSGRPVPDGAPGEIWVRGPSIARSYLTAEGRRMPAIDDDGWLHTGDRGHLDVAGRLYVTGRLSDTIITGGEKVDPAEVENALSTMPGIREVAVLGLPDTHWGEAVTAMVVLEDSCGLTLEQVRTHLCPQLAGFKLPRRVMVVDELPRTPTGKVRRSRLRNAAVVDAPCSEL
jgi:fatty-acyl-CoA synthase